MCKSSRQAPSASRTNGSAPNPPRSQDHASPPSRNLTECRWKHLSRLSSIGLRPRVAFPRTVHRNQLQRHGTGQSPGSPSLNILISPLGRTWHVAVTPTHIERPGAGRCASATSLRGKPRTRRDSTAVARGRCEAGQVPRRSSRQTLRFQEHAPRRGGARPGGGLEPDLRG